MQAYYFHTITMEFLLYLIQCIGSCNAYGSQNHEDHASRAGDDKQRVPPTKDQSETSRARDTHNNYYCEFLEYLIMYTVYIK